MTKVHLSALGCRVNEAELEGWSQDFRARGIEPTAEPEEADLLVVNTCAVTTEAARKSRQLLRRSRRRNPDARLVVSGCYATLAPAQVNALPGIHLLVDNTAKHELVARAVAALELPATGAPAAAPDAEALFRRGRQRAFVKVQDGCRHRCTFCIVTVARGAEHSRPIAAIVREIDALVASGIREVLLTGIHLGGYGSDTGETLATLIEAVLARTAVPRLRLGSLEPWDLPPGFLALFADDRLMPHLHLPLQSGCDATLKRMARRCRTGEFERLAGEARAAIPHLNLTTDVIAGFPGETEAEWRQSLAFIEQMGFGDLHVFPYSARAGTAAARLPGHLPEATKRARAGELRALGREMRRAFLTRQLGRPAEVLWERCDGEAAAARLSGLTDNYLPVTTGAAAAERVNTIERVTPTAVAEETLALQA